MKFSIFLDVVKTVNQIQFVIVEEKERQKTNSEWQKKQEKKKDSHFAWFNYIYKDIFWKKQKIFVFILSNT